MSKSVKYSRNDEITDAYFEILNKHLHDIVEGRVVKMLELSEIARAMYISPQHLSDTIKLTKGYAPCYFYDEKILIEAKKMLAETELPIAEIARILTYDPSNFSKFFKRKLKETPGQYRERIKK
ncbi:AraC family transcriptional regulator [Chitinophaga sp. 212800010-3]|uniref:helix-turn-helix domain-containing protein n=1 Tax=unclassified Chitinophaga TaxID=2619133 RepID=UPI002DE56BCF|nr:HTH araC/xylS-type domain-containing protein [Chitinophaga sp. 212800010-3]